MKVQVITTQTGDRLVVIPESDYEALLATADDVEDAAAVTSFRRRLASGDEELVPASIVDRILDGENRIRVWRDHRGLTAADLAGKAGIAPDLLAGMEGGDGTGSIDALRGIAAALDVTLDDLAG